MLSKKEVEKIVTELRMGAKEVSMDMPMGDAEIFDIVDGVLFDEDGLEEGIKKHYNIQDAQGWLANQIS